MDAAQCSTLAAVLAQVPDPRARRGRRYVWSVLLSLIVAGLASGQTTPSAIGQWVREHAEQVRLLCGGRVPSAATLRRVLARTDAVRLDEQLAQFTQPARGGGERGQHVKPRALVINRSISEWVGVRPMKVSTLATTTGPTWPICAIDHLPLRHPQ
jgi:hypothetical protein